jgi:hypothetical protein
MLRMMRIPFEVVKPGAVAWLTGRKAESGRTGREQIPEHPMNSLLTVATLLALIALSDGSLIIDVPALTGPSIHRGVE